MLRMHTVCAPVFHCYSCPLATFACPIGILANFSALHMIPFAARGDAGDFRGRVRQLRVRLGLPLRLLAGLGRLASDAQVHAARLDGRFSLCRAGGVRVGDSVLVGRGASAVFLPPVPGRAPSRRRCPTWRGWPSRASRSYGPRPRRLTILGLFSVAMLFTWRPWCTLFCPLGAIYGLMNHVSLLFLRFHQQRCRDCELCRSLCLDRSRPRRRVDGMRCVRCLECTRCQAVTVATVFTRPEET